MFGVFFVFLIAETFLKNVYVYNKYYFITLRYKI